MKGLFVPIILIQIEIELPVLCWKMLESAQWSSDPKKQLSE